MDACNKPINGRYASDRDGHTAIKRRMPRSPERVRTHLEYGTGGSNEAASSSWMTSSHSRLWMHNLAGLSRWTPAFCISTAVLTSVSALSATSRHLTMFINVFTKYYLVYYFLVCSLLIRSLRFIIDAQNSEILLPHFKMITHAAFLAEGLIGMH